MTLPASDYITESATELPAERTLRTATFDLGNGKRAQVSVAPDLFTHNPHQPDAIIFANSKGEKQGNSFVFDYLPQDTRVSFDLTKPSYTLSKGTHSFTLSFPTQSSLAGTIINDHQVSYPLSKNATLVWTVDGTNVRKEIHVKKQALPTEDPVTTGRGRFSFSITSTLTKSLQNNSIILFNESKEIFRTEKPYLLTTTHYPLLNSISVIQNASDQYEYVYDESSLPEEYILDPSAGPNGPSTVIGFDTNPSNIGNVIDGTYAEVGVSAVSQPYQDITNFGFNVPYDVNIDGITCSITGYADDGFGGVFGTSEDSIKMIIGGVRTGNNKANIANNWALLQTFIFGGTADRWGANPTSAEVNANNFGVSLYFLHDAGLIAGGDTPDVLHIDAITMTIYYSVSSPDTPTGDGSLPIFLQKLRRDILKQKEQEPTDDVSLSGALFLDDNPNTLKDEEERATGAGATFALSGTTEVGKKNITRNITVKRDGTYALKIPRGTYTITNLKNEEMNTTILQELDQFTLKASNETRNIPFERTNVKRGEGCLAVKEINGIKETNPPTSFGLRGTGENKEKDVFLTLLNRLGITPPSQANKLMTRRDFFRLGLDLHCMGALTPNPSPFRERGELPTIHYLPTDLSPEAQRRRVEALAKVGQLPTSQNDQKLIDTLTYHNLPHTKTIKGKQYPDLNAPITEKDAQTFLIALQRKEIKEIKENKGIKDGRTLTTDKALKMLLASSFHEGHIRITNANTNVEEQMKSLTPNTYNLTPISSPCLTLSLSRPSTLLPSDILPNNPLSSTITSLLTIRTTTDKPQYLLTGTKRATEFGVEKGITTMNLNTPVSLAEFLRTLTLLSCTLPPHSSFTLTTPPNTDSLASLPKNNSFFSRLFFTVQTIIEPYQSTLLSFLPTTLSPRNPSTPLTIREATSLLTSTLFFTQLHQGTLKPSSITLSMQDTLHQDLMNFFAPEQPDTPFRRSHLITLLSSLLHDQLPHPATLPSEAERWMWWVVKN